MYTFGEEFLFPCTLPGWGPGPGGELSSGPLAPGLRLLVAVLGTQLLGVGRGCGLAVGFMRKALAFWMFTFLMKIYKLIFFYRKFHYFPHFFLSTNV